MNLVWKPEKAKLRLVRHIICEVPELLMEILEHDFTGNGIFDPPEDPIEIRYYWDRGSRGAAWSHLMQNIPIIEVERGGETEHFKPVTGEKFNPYRKAHGGDYWAWYVTRWELKPPKEKDEPKANKEVRTITARDSESTAEV